MVVCLDPKRRNIMLGKRSLYFIGSLLIFAGCASNTVSKDTQAIKVSYSWDGIKRCKKVSPTIYLSGVPKGTSSLDVKMIDLDSLRSYHGGGKVVYSGKNVIPKGALRSFVGPCPPRGTVHSYKFMVKAKDKDGNTIGYGEAVRNFGK